MILLLGVHNFQIFCLIGHHQYEERKGGKKWAQQISDAFNKFKAD